jgi:2'-5' RNA ligase
VIREASPDLPRLFFAVPLDDAACAAVSGLVADVQGAAEALAEGRRSPVRWVRLDGLHVTLRFLGPAPDERLPELAGIVDASAASSAPFDVRISGAGAFPSPRRPRTLWLRIADGADAFADLARRVDAALAAVGWALEDRPFRPHLTLARADGRREGPSVARLLTERASTFETGFRADRLVLYESITGGGPARYVDRHSARLGG